MIVTINGTEYALRENNPYISNDINLIIYIEASSIDEVITVIGDKATVVISEALAWNDVSLNKISKFGSNPSICEVIFNFKNLEQKVQTNSDDIEAISQAIVELAEIIGGGE